MKNCYAAYSAANSSFFFFNSLFKLFLFPAPYKAAIQDLSI